MQTIKTFSLAIVKFVLRYILYWLILFNATRLLFVIYYYQQTFKEHATDVLFIPYHALMLDLSMISYILAIPLLLVVAQIFINQKVIEKMMLIYTMFISIIYLLIGGAEINLYAEWLTKIDYRAVIYLKTPDEVFRTATWWQTIIFFIYTLAFGYGAYKLYLFLFRKQINLNIQNKWQKIGFAFTLLIVGSAFIGVGIRGGIQQIPINQSSAYFSQNNSINLTSVNSMWNLLGSLYQNAAALNTNPYITMPHHEAQAIVDSLYMVPKDTTIYFLNHPKPNIILLLLESYSADLIESCGGDSGISPQLEKIISEGYLFDQIYASGTLSHQGIASIYSSFPAQPATSIIKEQAKFSKLPSLNERFNKMGYYTSFYFGGQLSYANIKSYMYFNNFKKIKDIDNYDSDIPRGKLGIHDGYTLPDHLQELNKMPQPFFSGLFTVSTHSPYDIPAAWSIKKGGSEQDYLNAAHYSDSCIGVYINNCKKQEWYKNTLFILVADHSKHTHFDRNYFEPLNRHIPLIFFGDVIKQEFRGKTNSFKGSKSDIAATLLKQLHQNANEFAWSRNMMNPYSKPFIYYSLVNGFGWANDNCWLAYSYQSHDYDWNTCNNKTEADSMAHLGKAYLQTLFQQYLDY
ncbi:MAG: sulfatase-like hydrolase/transferase [Bacteroidia bacterium]|nr:sulfatase-like hydrolase/transferase [Bacteroidia bacterium]MCZ2248525.1 sulfatase-like hydrolase/transferase [Bacteroidia bacterium]